MIKSTYAHAVPATSNVVYCNSWRCLNNNIQPKVGVITNLTKLAQIQPNLVFTLAAASLA
jgi:hypothetical protein